MGRGGVLNNSPYDLAAASLILEEAGALVTDAYGASLENRPLLGQARSSRCRSSRAPTWRSIAT